MRIYKNKKFNAYFLAEEILSVFPEWRINDKQNKFQFMVKDDNLIIYWIEEIILSKEDEKRLDNIVDKHVGMKFEKAKSKGERISELEAIIQTLLTRNGA